MTGAGDTYGLGARARSETLEAPRIAWRPRAPRSFKPRIGLIGCGGISELHLKAYAAAGFDVAILCDRTLAKAERRRAQYFPAAAVTADWKEVLARDDVTVVDLTPHPRDRLLLMEAALATGKHVLSQKPFVLDLAEGRRLCDLADARGVTLAVNQNGRFAPHLAWMREAARGGLLGTISAVDVSIHWNHQWVAGTPFDATPHLLLFDFGIHWFDFMTSLFPGRRATRVQARIGRAAGQRAQQPLLGQVLVEYPGSVGGGVSDGSDGVRATLSFHGASDHYQQDTTVVTGGIATARATGPDLDQQVVTFHTAAGVAQPELEGSWFTTGFQDAMTELLAAVEERRSPLHDARRNLDSLELAFAACASSQSDVPVTPGAVSRLP